MDRMYKEKNFICVCVNDNATPYKLDINTGELYGRSGKILKRTPAGFADIFQTNSDLCNVTRFILEVRNSMDYATRTLTYANLTSIAQYLSLMDKLDSIGYTISRLRYGDLRKVYLDFVNTYFKVFAKRYKNNPHLQIEEFYQNYYEEMWINEHHLNNIEPHIANFLFSNRSDELIMSNLDTAVWYLRHNLYIFCQNIDNHKYYTNQYLINYLVDFYTMCNRVGHTPTKDDFFKQFIAVKKTYLASKETFDIQALNDQLSKHSKAWGFETEQVQIIVPTTPDDFKQEAQMQHNCVYTNYLPKVINGDTNVIFFRKKSAPTQSYITCEVSNSGRIIQFLLMNNENPQWNTNKHQFELALQRQFAEHLKNVWE